jgi:sec-independent protein translocase protein TatB
MNFLGIGVAEIALIMVIAVLVLGPERIPEFAVRLARAIRWLRGYANENTAELRAEFSELMKEYEEVRQELRELRGSVDRDVEDLSKDLDKTKREFEGATQEMDKTLADTGPIVEPGGDIPPKLRADEDGDEQQG